MYMDIRTLYYILLMKKKIYIYSTNVIKEKINPSRKNFIYTSIDKEGLRLFFFMGDNSNCM